MIQVVEDTGGGDILVRYEGARYEEAFYLHREFLIKHSKEKKTKD